MSGVGGAVCEEEKTSSECLELGKGSKGEGVQTVMCIQ